MFYPYREDGVAGVREVAGDDAGCQGQGGHVGTGHFDEKVRVSYLNGTERGAVDDRRHGEHFFFIVDEQGEFGHVLENPAVFLSLGMIGENLAAGHGLGTGEGNKAGCVRINGCVVYRPGNVRRAVNTHGY